MLILNLACTTIWFVDD